MPFEFVLVPALCKPRASTNQTLCTHPPPHHSEQSAVSTNSKSVVDVVQGGGSTVKRSLNPPSSPALSPYSQAAVGHCSQYRPAVELAGRRVLSAGPAGPIAASLSGAKWSYHCEEHIAARKAHSRAGLLIEPRLDRFTPISSSNKTVPQPSDIKAGDHSWSVSPIVLPVSSRESSSSPTISTGTSISTSTGTAQQSHLLVGLF